MNVSVKINSTKSEQVACTNWCTKPAQSAKVCCVRW